MREKYFSWTLALCLFLVASLSLISAEENNSTELTENLTTLNSSNLTDNINNSDLNDEVISNWRYSWEKFKINFIWNQAKKAKRELMMAQWKLAEAKFEAKRGNFNASEKAIEEHDRILEIFQNRIENMKNKSLTPGLDAAISTHQKNLENLNLLLESMNLTEKERERIEMRIEKIENNTAHLEDIMLRIQERREEKIAQLENRSDKIEERGDKFQDRLKNRSNSSEDLD